MQEEQTKADPAFSSAQGSSGDYYKKSKGKKGRVE